MKKYILPGLAVLLLFTSNLVTAAPDTTPQMSTVINTVMPTEIINGIEVPYQILLDAQMVFQGFAVSGAQKNARDGQQVYVLRMDSSDTKSGGNSFQLVFDKDWKFLERENIIVPKPVPPPPTPEESQPVPEETTESDHDENENQDRDHDNEEQEEQQDEGEPTPITQGPRRNRDSD